MSSAPGEAHGASGRRAQVVHVVLPAYNEERRIGHLLDGIDEAMEEGSLSHAVIVVDDGSTDATAAIVRQRAKRMPISLIEHPQNLGLGAAIRDGFAAAARQAAGRDVIVTMDADATHAPALILRMVRMLREGYDVVIASRYQPGSRQVGVPMGRRALSRAGSILVRVLFPTPGVRDYTCGFRAYRATVLQEAIQRFGSDFLSQDGFQCMVDILLKLRRMSVIFGEIPFLLRYDLKEGGSKMKIRETIANTLRLLLRHKLAR
jgi:dolichol-phosphate mannosyltransferase